MLLQPAPPGQAAYLTCVAASIAPPMRLRTSARTGPRNTSVTTATSAVPLRMSPYSTTPCPREDLQRIVLAGGRLGLWRRLWVGVGRDRHTQRPAAVEQDGFGAERGRALLDLAPRRRRQCRDGRRSGGVDPGLTLVPAILEHRCECR